MSIAHLAITRAPVSIRLPACPLVVLQHSSSGPGSQGVNTARWTETDVISWRLPDCFAAIPELPGTCCALPFSLPKQCSIIVEIMLTSCWIPSLTGSAPISSQSVDAPQSSLASNAAKHPTACSSQDAQSVQTVSQTGSDLRLADCTNALAATGQSYCPAPPPPAAASLAVAPAAASLTSPRQQERLPTVQDASPVSSGSATHPAEAEGPGGVLMAPGSRREGYIALRTSGDQPHPAAARTGRVPSSAEAAGSYSNSPAAASSAEQTAVEGNLVAPGTAGQDRRPRDAPCFKSSGAPEPAAGRSQGVAGALARGQLTASSVQVRCIPHRCLGMQQLHQR